MIVVLVGRQIEETRWTLEVSDNEDEARKQMKKFLVGNEGENIPGLKVQTRHHEEWDDITVLDGNGKDLSHIYQI